MILDSLKNAHLYYCLGGMFRQAFEFLEHLDVKTLKPGRVDITGGVYANVQIYKTKPRKECCLESHKKYADIQYVASGEEALGFFHLLEGGLNSKESFDEVKDIVFYEGGGTWMSLRAGYFAVLFPDDAHAPKGDLIETKEVTKLVVKVPL
jgi:YhcH/YjgK/YiaL family protein